MHTLNNFKMTIFSLFVLGMMSWEVKSITPAQCESNRETCWAQCDSDYDTMQSDCEAAIENGTINSQMTACFATRSQYCQPCQEECDKQAKSCGWKEN